MAIYDDDGSSYTTQTKQALRRLTPPPPPDSPTPPVVKGDYGFTQALKDGNISYFKQNFGSAKDWSLHHIIPQNLIRGGGDLAAALQDLTKEGLFSIRDGVKNGIWLPNNQDIANETGLALHNDNHKAYSAAVGDLMSKLWRETIGEVIKIEDRILTNPEYKAKLQVFELR